MNFIAPLTFADVGSKPTVDNADTDFPEPDSPTKATVFPTGILKEMFLTASTICPSFSNEITKSFTSRIVFTEKSFWDQMRHEPPRI